jgi:hypothetical protein
MGRNAAISTKTLHRSSGMVIAHSGPTCFVIWRGEVTPTTFGLQKAGLTHCVAEHPEGVAFICIIEPSAKPPSDELRVASTRMIQEQGARLKCVAVVIEGNGFRAAITRGVISGMALLLPRRQPSSAFTTVRSALTWVQQYVPVEAGQLATDIEKERASLAGPLAAP